MCIRDSLYIDYLKEKLEEEMIQGTLPKKAKYYNEFYMNLRKGIDYYRTLVDQLEDGTGNFLHMLNGAETEMDVLNYKYNLENK